MTACQPAEASEARGVKMIVSPIYFFSPMKVIIYTPYNNGVQNSEFKCSCFIKFSYQPFLIRKIA